MWPDVVAYLRANTSRRPTSIGVETHGTLGEALSDATCPNTRVALNDLIVAARMHREGNPPAPVSIKSMLEALCRVTSAYETQSADL